MTPAAPPPIVPRLHDVVVVGAGAVGLALAVALARAGLDVASVGPVPRERNGRTVALLDGAVRFLDGLGVWAAAAPHAAPLATMRIVDATDSLFRGPPVAFAATELGLPAFGRNIENAVLLDVLGAAAATALGLTRVSDWIAAPTFGAEAASVRLAGGGSVAGRLLIAADGARSALRQAAGIEVRRKEYPQVALTALLHHDAPHGDASTEFHTREGPFTLVPLVPAAGAPHRSSLVWVMSPGAAARRAAFGDEAFAQAIAVQSRHLLGSVRLASPVGRFPIQRVVATRLVATRLALVGEAAHALPPIGAQGLNLSLRDAATLADLLAGTRDPGAPAILAAYEAARRGDVALRVGGVDALNGSLLSHQLPVDALRGLGLAALAAVGPLRRAVMRQGLGLPAPGA